jgi:hypothetical protein
MAKMPFLRPAATLSAACSTQAITRSQQEPAAEVAMNFRYVSSVAGVALGMMAGAVHAQEKTSKRQGERRPMDRTEEITLARTAAPASVSDAATIWVLGPKGYEVAVEGTNGAACYVGRSWLDSVEPHCYDAEGAVTIMPMERRRVEMYGRGIGRDEVERTMADGITTGEFRLPRRPAVTYMMSPRQVLYDDDGSFVGQWRPHLMIFVPFLTNQEIGMSGAPDVSAAIVNGPGTAEANLMVIVKGFTSAGAGGK